MAHSTVDRVVTLIEREHRRPGACAQICVIRRDELVLDRALGCSPDALFLIYSASKPFVALLVHQLAERKQLHLDDPVARYWPEFAQQDKAAITIRHVLQHRAGLPLTGGLLTTLLHMHDFARSARAAARARPRWPAGSVAAYHIFSFGFILGELVQRVMNSPLRQVLSRTLLEPLGLDDVHLGLSDQTLPRAIPVIATQRGDLINQWQFNRRRIRQAVIPAANVSSNARQLARFYHMLARGGELDGVRVLDAATIAEAARPSNDGTLDAFIQRPVRWSQGFQLGGPGADPRDIARIMGNSSTPETFGHGGNASCLVWADPIRSLVLVYLSNLQRGIDRGSEHLALVSDAVRAAFA